MAISYKQSSSAGGVSGNKAKLLFTAFAFAAAAFIGVKSSPPRVAVNAPIIGDVSSNEVDAVRDAVNRDPAQLRAVDLDGNTPLHIAAMGGYGQMVQVLIDAGADVNAANRAGFTPLASALLSFEKNQSDIVSTLITAGARNDVQLADGRNLRQLAASLPNVSREVIALLGSEDAAPSGRREGQAVASASEVAGDRK